MKRVVILMFLVACGPSKPTSQPPAPPAPDAAIAAAIDASIAETCTMPDGTEARTFCAPIAHAGDPPMHTRNPDGTCGPCLLRCLPATAQIATPGGDRAIDALHEGDVVWTIDAAGARIAAPILRIRALDAPASHPLRRVRLDDGRVVSGSAGHPIGDGRTLADLAVGAALDGARVTAIDVIALGGHATWDLLPAGETGQYWADGVLLGSTLLDE